MGEVKTILDKEKFLVILELETSNLSRDVEIVREVIQDHLGDVQGIGWICTEILIDDVKAILDEKREAAMSEVKTNMFVRNPIYVEAIQVTEENLQKVSQWCGGRVHNVADGTVFIKVLGMKSKMIPRTKAFVGDWVLSGDKGFRVYTDSAFIKAFVSVPNEIDQKIDEINQMG